MICKTLTRRGAAILTLLTAISCAPAPQPLTEGEREAVRRLQTDIVGAWSCDEGGDFPFTMTLRDGGGGMWTGEDLTTESSDQRTFVRYDFEAPVTWRIVREGVKPYLITEVEDFDVVVIGLTHKGAELARSRKAVELAKNAFAQEFEDQTFKDNIARLSEDTLMLFSKGRVECKRLPENGA